MEESRVLSMKTLRQRLYHGAQGTITWTWASGGKSSVGYVVTRDNDEPVVTLVYGLRNAEDVVFRVDLEATPTQFGGLRWWLTCPLVVRGVPCQRRAGKLYLPPGSRYSGCRRCHNLTYRSSQEAHQAERVFGMLGLDPESAKLMASQWDRKLW